MTPDELDAIEARLEAALFPDELSWLAENELGGLIAEVRRLRSWISAAPFPGLDGATHHEDCSHWSCRALRGESAPEKA